MNVFEVVKENVTARQAAEAYGLKVGRTGIACCPFHSDKSPSMKLDRTGNRRFVPVMVYPERAEVHILADEQASREYINQMWAEAMEIYRSGNFRLRFSPAMNAYLKAHQKDFMPEDTKAGQILDYLERYSGSMVCSKQLYKEALGHDYDEPKQWELREINDIMNNAVTGWRAFSNPRS